MANISIPALGPAYKRTMQSVGKAPFVKMVLMPSQERLPYLRSAQFVKTKTGEKSHYSPKTICHKLCAMRKLCRDYDSQHILFDIYQNSPRVDSRVKNKARKLYNKLVPGANLPPVITKKIKKSKKVGSKIRKK